MRRVPTYKEVISGRKDKGKQKKVTEDAEARQEPEAKSQDVGGVDQELLPTADPTVDEDDFEEIVDRFESSYNFRFEEP